MEEAKNPGRPVHWETMRASGLEVAIVTRQLATLVGAGIQIPRALEAARAQVQDRNLGEALEGVVNCINSGYYLSHAMAQFPRIFQKVYISMIKVGESTGCLVDSMTRLADWLEGEQVTVRKVKAALTYPIFVVFLGFVLMLAMFYYVMPVLNTMFSAMGQELPMLTRIMMWITVQVRNPVAWMIMLALLAESIFLYNDRMKNPVGRLQLTRFWMKVPVLGTLMRCAAMARLCAAMGALLSVGVALLPSVKLGAEATANAVFEDDCANMCAFLRQGDNLSDGMLAAGTYPPSVVSMVAVGEESGRLAEIFDKLAEFYQQEVDYRLETLSAVLEPLLLLLVALMVGTGLVSIFLPLYGVLGKLAG